MTYSTISRPSRGWYGMSDMVVVVVLSSGLGAREGDAHSVFDGRIGDAAG